MNPRIITPIVRSSLRSTRCRYLHASQVIPEAESSLQARQRAQAAEAKAKAWYIEEEDDHVVPSSRSSGPVFTTYNPTTTLPEPAQDIPLQPIPSDLPEYAKPLHMFLTNNELFVPHSISFNRTQGSKASKSFTDFSDMQMERGKRRRGKTDSGDGIVIPGHEVGAFWNWIVVAQVAARGKGAVSRSRLPQIIYPPGTKIKLISTRSEGANDLFENTYISTPSTLLRVQT
jgi:hypothetical protein